MDAAPEPQGQPPTDAPPANLDDDSVRRQMHFRTGQVFSPAAPVTDQDLFAKRGDRMDDLIDASAQIGQHVAVYGERGVGKTSFVTVMADIYRNIILSGRVTCASGEDFSTIMRHAFRSILFVSEQPQTGFKTRTVEEKAPATALLEEAEVTPDDVRRALTHLSQKGSVILLIDEFDRVTDPQTRRKFADTIKSLSDWAVNATIVLVGVADTVGELIAEHESISRALVQIHMPRMAHSELGEIIDRALAALGMTIDPDRRETIITLSRGLPTYTHRLGLYAAASAIEHRRYDIQLTDVGRGIRETIEKMHAHISTLYQKATWSTRQTNYERVLLACALAPVDEFGYFAPADVRTPLSNLMGRSYDIPNYIANLNQLATDQRGSVLQKTGEARSFRYRFRDPMLEPYVILRGVDTGTLDFSKFVQASDG